MENTVGTPLSESFEVAFNQIHSWLPKNIKNARNDKFTALLGQGLQVNSLIRKHYHDLKMFARLRNSIVHDKVELGFYIAEPHPSVVNLIEKIAAKIEPKEALSIATKPVFENAEFTIGVRFKGMDPADRNVDSIIEAMKLIEKRTFV